MSFLQDTKIRTKILSVLIPICVIGIGGVALVASEYKHTDTTYREFINHDSMAAIAIERAPADLVAVAYTAYEVLTYGNGNPKAEEALKAYETAKSDLREELDEALSLMPENAAFIRKAEEQANAIFTHTDNAIALERQGRHDEGLASLDKANALVMQWKTDVGEWNKAAIQAMKDHSAEMTLRTDGTILTTLVALGGLFIAGIVASLFIVARGVTRPIDSLRARMLTLADGETQAAIAGLGRKDEVGQMADAVAVFRDNALERIRLEQEAEANRSLSEKERIEREAQKAREAEAVRFAVDNLAAGLAKLSEGDVSYRISQSFTEALDTVRRDFNNSAEKLETALTQVAENARGIEAGSNEIRSAADDLAKRTEQQAAAVEETAAALEQITTAVTDSTRRAQEAGQLVARTRTGAEQSGEVVRRAVSAMEQIERSSNEINSIIGVIDEIAFQTNLLALNAGVEAARAGEAGKGFAVVAQEVRELAQRSANAAKEIKTLITASNGQVREGVQLVGDTGRALETIVAEVQEINRHVNAIVDAAQEQSSGLQQINTAVNQMDQDTQKNAAMVEETTAATHSLSREVVSLNELLRLFKLSGARQAPASVRAATGAESPSASPVRALGRKVAAAFAGNAAVKQDTWEEF
ncbi:methyl-accepting chemotaxis protein [Shinella pollutisoli]|uniref:Methyl-accepting chemotaxis protein n=1 Tax=Shinella pollutisoli TaxID=2250594 RepID=A0ABV7DFM8_9HYPH|nr:HAMP domain-containing methyl-accepting chemotaxis protein [Shinella pollutisoli]